MVSRLDPASGTVTASFKAARDSNGLAYGEGLLWVSSAKENRVLAINPESGQVQAAIEVEGGPSAIVFGP